ncbi:MAG: hypothetical protein ACK6BG_05820 [Cyanobacteriota bacterium]
MSPPNSERVVDQHELHRKNQELIQQNIKRERELQKEENTDGGRNAADAFKKLQPDLWAGRGALITGLIQSLSRAGWPMGSAYGVLGGIAVSPCLSPHLPQPILT